MAKVLLTGTAGFIGFHLTKVLLEEGHNVYGIDCVNDYYDVNVKFSRLKMLGFDTEFILENEWIHQSENNHFSKVFLQNKDQILKIFDDVKPDYVINLAAQAGVRYSIQNPYTYIESNINGFINILEGCRHNNVKHLIYASSSSVYGINQSIPFSVNDSVDHPISLYAASKKSNELMAHTYSYLFKIPTTGLRFFTVYGPYGRPDMALFIFTKNILEGKPISVFNNGNMKRDFTYVDDITESIKRLLPLPPKAIENFDRVHPNPSNSLCPYTVFNIGNNSPVGLMDFVAEIENATGKKAQINFEPMQAGDVESTYADVQSLFETTNFQPKTTIKAGIKSFVDWYREYYKI